jgi:hypothetical protein
MLSGGLNLVAPYLGLKPGQAVAGINFEPGLNGGYRRLAGYERLDGRARPHQQTYMGLVLSSVAGVTAGQVLNGVTSGASATVVGIDEASGTVAVAGTAGAFIEGESLGAITLVRLLGINIGVDALDGQWQLAAQDYYRALIQPVPGTGPVRGVFQHDGVTVAFRDNLAGTACVGYTASAAGWQVLPTGHTVRFKLASGQFAVGDVVTGPTGSSQVRKVVVYNGATQTNDASGYLVLAGGSGSFLNGQALQVGGVTKATADGPSAAVKFTPGGSFRFVSHNFYAGASTYNLYGCDGVNPAFEWDGQNVSPILMPDLVGAPFDNAPLNLMAHKGHLFLAFRGGSLQHSVVGEPLTFNGFLGAAEFGAGAEITDLAQQAGDVLLVYTRRSTLGLYGSGLDDWQMRPVAPEAGAIAGSAQTLGTSIALDDRGLTSVQRSQAYGNFESGTISRVIQPLLDGRKESALQSCVVRRTNQYRLFFDDGSFLIAYMPGGDSLPEFMLGQYPVRVRCVCNAEGADGDEAVLFGSDDGLVYEAEVGNNFDGQSISSFLRLPFNHSKSSRIRKRYRRAQLDLQTQGAVTLSFAADIDYGSPDALQPRNFTNDAIFGGGGYWEAADWDQVYWDAQVISNAQFDLDGTGVNLSLSVVHDSAVTPPFTLHSIQIDYEPRRRER